MLWCLQTTATRAELGVGRGGGTYGQGAGESSTTRETSSEKMKAGDASIAGLPCVAHLAGHFQPRQTFSSLFRGDIAPGNGRRRGVLAQAALGVAPCRDGTQLVHHAARARRDQAAHDHVLL